MKARKRKPKVITVDTRRVAAFKIQAPGVTSLVVLAEDEDDAYRVAGNLYPDVDGPWTVEQAPLPTSLTEETTV